jgi:pyridoxine 4-dehydrogenase
LDVLEVCEQHSIAYLPWSPTKGARANDTQAIVKELADEKGVSTYAIAIAWLKSLSPSIVPIPGITRIESVRDSLNVVELSHEELARLNEGFDETLPMDAELLSDQPKS